MNISVVPAELVSTSWDGTPNIGQIVLSILQCRKCINWPVAHQNVLWIFWFKMGISRCRDLPKKLDAALNPGCNGYYNFRWVDR